MNKAKAKAFVNVLETHEKQKRELEQLKSIIGKTYQTRQGLKLKIVDIQKHVAYPNQFVFVYTYTEKPPQLLSICRPNIESFTGYVGLILTWRDECAHLIKDGYILGWRVWNVEAAYIVNDELFIEFKDGGYGVNSITNPAKYFNLSRDDERKSPKYNIFNSYWKDKIGRDI